MDQVLIAIQLLQTLRASLDLWSHWSENHTEYQATLQYIRQHDYHGCLDKLQQLVVQRLFELSKANLLSLGKSMSCLWYLMLISCLIRV